MNGLLSPPVVPDPAVADALASRVAELASVLADAGGRIGVVDADWSGEAADAFRSVRDLQPSRFTDAADTLTAVSGAMTAYADALRDIRARLAGMDAAPVDRDTLIRQASADLTAAQAACADALDAAAAQAPQPSAPGWFHRMLADVVTPTLRMPDSVRTDDGLLGLFGGIGGDLLDAAGRFEQPWAYVPWLSPAIRRAGGVPEEAAPSGRYRLGALALDVGTAGLGGPDAAVGAEEAGQRILLRVTVPEEAFDLGRMPDGALRQRAWRVQIAQRISHGHSFPKHVLGIENTYGADFAWMRSENELRRHVVRVMRGGEHRTKVYEHRAPGSDLAESVTKHGFWKDGDLVVFNPKDKQGDLGTVFTPADGYERFERNFPR